MPTGVEESAAVGGGLLLLNQVANALMYLNQIFPPLKYIVSIALLEGFGFVIKFGTVSFSVGTFLAGFVSFITSNLAGVSVDFYAIRWLCYLLLLLGFMAEFKIIPTNRGNVRRVGA